MNQNNVGLCIIVQTVSTITQFALSIFFAIYPAVCIPQALTRFEVSKLKRSYWHFNTKKTSYLIWDAYARRSRLVYMALAFPSIYGAGASVIYESAARCCKTQTVCSHGSHWQCDRNTAKNGTDF